LFSQGHWPTEAIWLREEPVDEAKPFKIPKREIWEAFKRVKANQGAAGVDGQSIAAFEANLSGNLYKLWNRMSSGSYLPPPVRRVDIPIGDLRVGSVWHIAEAWAFAGSRDRGQVSLRSMPAAVDAMAARTPTTLVGLAE
jgi:hypothetical protein